MHQDAAYRVRSEAACFVSAAVNALCHAYESRLIPFVGELRRVMNDENLPAGCREMIPGRVKMTAQNITFADPPIGEEAIGRFGVGPILANQGNALAHGAPKAFQQ